MTAGAPASRAWYEATVPAERYERGLVPVLFADWAEALVQIAGLQPGERVLDLACGTGVVARAAARGMGSADSVVGVDVSADMLAVARRAGAGITWRQASALDTGLPDASFDAAFCQQGLQFFPDRAAALRELHRLLAPGGRAVLSAWSEGSRHAYAPIAAAIDRRLAGGTAAAGFVDTIFGLTDAEELRTLLTGAGFEDLTVELRSRPARVDSAEAWAEAFLGAAPVPGVAGLDATTRAAIVADAAEALRAGSDGPDQRFGFSLETHVAVARR